MKYRMLLWAVLVINASACVDKNKTRKGLPEKTNEVTVKTIVEKVDALNAQLHKANSGMALIASLDHHRMAKEAGVYTPPAIAGIFSDPKINTAILAKSDPLVGLDLPFKYLCYSEADTLKADLAYTSTAFIAKRHNLSDETLAAYKSELNKSLDAFDAALISSTNTEGVKAGFGMVKIQSDFDFKTTVENLKAIVNAQSDTRWFGEIDYKSEAKAFDVELNSNILLLFGGPAPGGKAMMTTPKIGLDAFCQKLLVYQNDNDEVWIAFNDIVAFSELYYGSSTKPQNMINKRLTMTFTKAVKIKSE